MSNSKNKSRIKKMFSGLQAQMIANLMTNRISIDHAPSKGDSIENVWIKWLRIYLPNRYSVDSAFVIDHNGAISDQIDLVIYDQQYTPFVFTQDNVKFIPAEGVYAVFELKPDLKGTSKVSKESMSYIEYACRKIESVRRLSRTSTMIVDRGTQRKPRPLTKILGGILTIENSYAKTKTIIDHFNKSRLLGSIDIGCCVNYGSFFIDYTGVENVEITDPAKRIESYYQNRKFRDIQISNKDESLVTFFLQLSRYLQQGIGTVAAIDLAKYAKNLDFDIDREI